MISLASCVKHNNNVLELTLQDKDGNIFTMKGLAKNKYAVLVFFDADCPLCKNYIYDLNSLQEKYAEKNIGFYLVFPAKDILKKIKPFEKEYSVKTTLLIDTAHLAVKSLEASVTPEAFIIDHKGMIVYSGGIDNKMYATGKIRKVVTENYLDNALQNLLAGKKIEVEKTKAFGCLIER